MDGSLTIILAIKDRLPLAHRWMRFMNQEQCPYLIVIADGSLDSDSGRFFARASDFPNLAYEYIRFPADENYSDYYKKISDALGLVDTPYVLMADDDDFYCMEGIKTTMKFLDEHPDFVCARGSYLGFSVRTPSHEEDVDAHTVYGEMSFRGAIYPSAIIDEDSSAGRLAGSFSRWTPHWYNIHRADILRACWNEVAALNIRNIFLFEHTVSAMIAVRGKIFAGQYPYYFRQVEGAYITTSQEAKTKGGDWFDQMLSESWSADYSAFVKTVSADVKKRDGITEEAAVKIVHTVYKNLFGPIVASVFALPVRQGAAKTKMRYIYKHVKGALLVFAELFRANRRGNDMKELEASECTVRVRNFLANKN
jgi:glycosyltransferase domain-containing protein